MSWQSITGVLGVLMLIDGLFLLCLKKATWQESLNIFSRLLINKAWARKSLNYFSTLSIGQVHFIGLVISTMGGLLFLSAFYK